MFSGFYPSSRSFSLKVSAQGTNEPLDRERSIPCCPGMMAVPGFSLLFSFFSVFSFKIFLTNKLDSHSGVCIGGPRVPDNLLYIAKFPGVPPPSPSGRSHGRGLINFLLKKKDILNSSSCPQAYCGSGCRQKSS